jgi:predicted small lipoprotein YifL
VNVRAGSRATVAALAVVMALTLAGCGSSGPSKAELASQDRVVLATARRQSAHDRLVAAVRAKQRQARARVRAEIRRRNRAQRRNRVVVRDVQVLTIEMTPSGVCGPIRGGNARSRRERRERRRQALDYLNLHC